MRRALGTLFPPFTNNILSNVGVNVQQAAWTKLSMINIKNIFYGDFMKYSVSFRIIADDLNPLEITQILGINPSISHIKGEQKTTITKKGKTLIFSPCKFGLWSINSLKEKCQSINSHLNYLLSILYPLKEKLLRLSEKGCSMDIYCGVFTHEVDQPGFIKEPEVLYKLGDLKITLGMSIY